MGFAGSEVRNDSHRLEDPSNQPLTILVRWKACTDYFQQIRTLQQLPRLGSEKEAQFGALLGSELCAVLSVGENGDDVLNVCIRQWLATPSTIESLELRCQKSPRAGNPKQAPVPFYFDRREKHFRIPSIAEPECRKAGGHNVHNQVIDPPPADRRIRLGAFAKAQHSEPICCRIVLQRCLGTNHAIHILCRARRIRVTSGKNERDSGSSYKHDLGHHLAQGSRYPNDGVSWLVDHAASI